MVGQVLDDGEPHLELDGATQVALKIYLEVLCWVLEGEHAEPDVFGEELALLRTELLARGYVLFGEGYDYDHKPVMPGAHTP